MCLYGCARLHLTVLCGVHSPSSDAHQLHTIHSMHSPHMVRKHHVSHRSSEQVATLDGWVGTSLLVCDPPHLMLICPGVKVSVLQVVTKRDIELPEQPAMGIGL